jgi:hypothetical protein
MSYDDGDVSMASIRDESFNMSVDHDTFDVVWHSTQQPAIQSILEESKCAFNLYFRPLSSFFTCVTVNQTISLFDIPFAMLLSF